MPMDGSSIGSNRVAQESFMDGPGKDLSKATSTITELCPAGLVSIESLPDDVLLEIFYQVRVNPATPADKLFIASGGRNVHRSLKDLEYYRWQLYWPKLVQVCRRWRFVIFASPLRLKLQLFCTPNKPVRKLLDIWPTFPLVVWHHEMPSKDKFDNIIAALEHRDRIQEISIGDPLTQYGLWERIATLMEKPFPELTSLSLFGVLALPNTFLNGSASRLRHLYLWTISFPSLPRLLLSTRDLRSLHLDNIPSSGYIPPETMATCLSIFPKLKSLIIKFQSLTPDPKPSNRPLPPQSRSILPALTELLFQGVSEYFEVLVARIDIPGLNRLRILFFNHPVFDIPQTFRFFGHIDSFKTSNLTLGFYSSFVSWFNYDAVFYPSDMGPFPSSDHRCSLHIRCSNLDWQLLSLAQICSQIVSFRSTVASLAIKCDFLPGFEIDPTVWPQLFRSFPAAQSLQIHADLELSIATALQGLTGESATDVFPSLQSLSIVDRSDEAAPQDIQSFLTARQRCGRPVAVSRCRK
jgi:F-box-like